MTSEGVTRAASAGKSPLERLEFSFEFRKYQRLILTHLGERIDTPQVSEKFHIVSPPGSGKTILGIELIRRLGERAVVFAPTSTIQRQWHDKVSMFAQSPDHHDQVAGMDPHALRPITIFTYQLLTAAGDSRALLAEAALEQWIDQLVTADRSLTPEYARARIDTMRANNPDSHRKELARRTTSIRRSLLRERDPDVGRFLHPNARALIDRLVDSGVKTVVLDECHHLLDYWAVVLAYFIARIDTPRVIGLTATLPSPEDQNEYENYTGLLGEVDYEVPTPAVVKEGDLAPYRDLVAFVEPTDAEAEYLTQAHTAFDAAVESVTHDPRFVTWLQDASFAAGESAPQRWLEMMRNDTPLAVAAIRHLRALDLPDPPDLPIPLETGAEPEFGDKLAVVGRYALDVLKVSPDATDHAQLKALRQSLTKVGFTLTETGLRQQRTPGDLILAYSDAKAHMTGAILGLEAEAMGDRLRAVVVTDFERTGAAATSADRHAQAGSARKVFLDLVHHRRSHDLDPVLVTGRTLWLDADHGQELIDTFNTWLADRNLRATCVGEPGPYPGVIEVHGEGPQWSSGTYVSMVTYLFETGRLRCLVGTRGLFAEGWDTLTLNTLVDLTTATTATTAQQLRGRSIRIDPAWPRKVAHNWDVIAVHKGAEKGDRDIRRLRTKHQRVWGVTPDYPGVMPEVHGHVVRGLRHLDPELKQDMATRKFRDWRLDEATERSMQQVTRRDASYQLWDVGAAYSNFSYRATTLHARDLTIRTVHSVQQTLKRYMAEFRFALVMIAIEGALIAAHLSSTRVRSIPGGWRVVMALVGLVAVATVIRAAVVGWRAAKHVLKADHADAALLDIGRAVMAALKDAGLVSTNLQPEFVRVVEQPDLSYSVQLDYASTSDAAIFIDAYRQVFAPVLNQRYLVSRNESALPAIWLRPLWAVLRRVVRTMRGTEVTYHPVPDVLASHKRRAEAFAKRWHQYVGSGDLTYTRTPAGWRILIQARAKPQPTAPSDAYDVWR